MGLATMSLYGSAEQRFPNPSVSLLPQADDPRFLVTKPSFPVDVWSPCGRQPEPCRAMIDYSSKPGAVKERLAYESWSGPNVVANGRRGTVVNGGEMDPWRLHRAGSAANQRLGTRSGHVPISKRAGARSQPATRAGRRRPRPRHWSWAVRPRSPSAGPSTRTPRPFHPPLRLAVPATVQLRPR